MIVIGLCIGLIVGLCLGLVVGYKYVKIKMSNQINRAEMLADKHLAIVNLLSMWLQNKENKLSIETYLLEIGVKKVAIYGMSFVGERLYDELEKSKITVEYCIDKNVNNIYKDVNILSPNDKLNCNIDAIIVTAFTYFDDIESELKKKINVPIISIDDIVYSL